MLLQLKGNIPITDELLDELAHASWFTSLDLRAGFHQIRMKPGEEYKTAFQTHMGMFEFRVMPFGLTGALGTFQAAMNSSLAPFLRKFVLVFFDDILIYSSTLTEHLQHLRMVFEVLLKDEWKIKLSKCSFAQTQISYLGHTISAQGVGTDPKKVQAITDWPTPTNVKELRSFLGLAGYYRKFVKRFGIISKPLTDLLKKNVVFIWNPDHAKSFAALQKALSPPQSCHYQIFLNPFALRLMHQIWAWEQYCCRISILLLISVKLLVRNPKVCLHMRRNIWPLSWQSNNGDLTCSMGNS